METRGNTILITGGATGIGFAMAERFVALDNTVIICGRRQAKLDEAKRRLPGLHAKRCDISKEGERRELYEWVAREFKELNVLVNNAGIQRPIDFRKGMEDLLKNEDEIEINLRSQIYLSALFIPLLMKQGDSAIINVGSGLGFVPLAMFPVYCATKAAIHSFCMSLRHQLRDTPIKVFEVIPPTVHDTELKGKPIPKTDYSISAAEMGDAIMEGFGANQYEIGAGPSRNWLSASKSDLDKAFQGMNH
jgi:uncharacterized oxidoreductase